MRSETQSAGLRLLTVLGVLLSSSFRISFAEDSAEPGPYSPDRDQLWNRLHRGLFLRTDAASRQHIHSTDPLLYRGGKFLLTGEPHRKAVSLLDEFLKQDAKAVASQSLVRRAMLQRDLWGAFDYVAWYPDEWVHRSRFEPAAMKLRSRLARAIGRLSLTKRELTELQENYAAAVASGDFALEHDSENPKKPFLPADLFDPKGNWVRFRDPVIKTAEQNHFQGSGGRAIHLTFLRLPEGREATQKYLNEVSRRTGSDKQFPVGTMAALVRRAIVINQAGRMQPVPITELVQIRVYRRIPEDPKANFHGDLGEQDVYEFVLDREKLFAGKHGLRAVTPDEPSVSFFRKEGDPFVPKHRTRLGISETQMQSCIQCHQGPGVYSMRSMQASLHRDVSEAYRTYSWNVDHKGPIHAKARRFDWGLLQGLLEANPSPQSNSQSN
ncbi:MAG: hypothetical protein H8E37_07965 [Planctomycetes bacterium]|nr:hypothetical protein [Planctomycetota bacterium]